MTQRISTRRGSGCRSWQSGVTLIELMIGMTLGLGVVLTVGYVYVNSVQTYGTQSAFSRLQEGARFAFETMSHELRMAGLDGCGAPNSAVASSFSPSWYGDLGNALVGYDAPNTSSPATGLPADISGALNGRDALTVVRADDAREYLITAYNSGTNTFTTSAAHGLSSSDVGKVMVVCDPSGGTDKATTFDITAVGGTDTFTGRPMTATYTPSTSNPIKVLRIVATTYFIRNNTAGIPSLYRQVLTASGGTEAQELIEGVEDMQITYGTDTSVTADGVPDAYLTASGVTGVAGTWSRVLSIRVGLLLRAGNANALPAPATYFYQDNTGDGIVDANDIETAPDRQLRKAVSHIIAVRNRL